MNAREQRLAILLISVILIGGGWLVFKRMSQWKSSIAAREIVLVSKKAEATALLSQKDFWKTRSEWLAAKQPVYPAKRADADNAIDELIRNTARDNGITIVTPQAEEPERLDIADSTSASMLISAKGPLEKMLRWLHGLQQPDAFITIKGLALAPDPEDPAQVEVTNLRIQKWYRNAAP